MAFGPRNGRCVVRGRGWWWGLGVWTAAALPAAAQSVTLSAGVSNSDLREYDSPTVLGIGMAVPVVGWLGVRLDARRHSDEQSWLRSTCQGLIDPSSDLCQDDRFQSAFTLTTLSLGPWVSVPVSDRWGLEGALQWTRGSFDGEWRGQDTGATLGRAPREAHWGISALVGVSWRWAEQWAAAVTARRDSPQVTTCIEDIYYPYCGTTAFRTLEVGVTYRR